MNRKQKRVKMPAVAGSRTKNTYSLSSQCSATEPWQLNDHEPSICPAQVALNASVAHLAATASLFILLYFRLITSKFIYFQHEARCSEHCCMHVWQSKCQWEYSLLCFGDLAYLWLDFLLVQVIAVTYFQVIWYYVTCKLEAACSPHSTEINVFSPINNQ